MPGDIDDHRVEAIKRVGPGLHEVSAELAHRSVEEVELHILVLGGVWEETLMNLPGLGELAAQLHEALAGHAASKAAAMTTQAPPARHHARNEHQRQEERAQERLNPPAGVLEDFASHLDHSAVLIEEQCGDAISHDPRHHRTKALARGPWQDQARGEMPEEDALHRAEGLGRTKQGRNRLEGEVHAPEEHDHPACLVHEGFARFDATRPDECEDRKNGKVGDAAGEGRRQGQAVEPLAQDRLVGGHQALRSLHARSPPDQQVGPQGEDLQQRKDRAEEQEARTEPALHLSLVLPAEEAREVLFGCGLAHGHDGKVSSGSGGVGFAPEATQVESP